MRALLRSLQIILLTFCITTVMGGSIGVSAQEAQKDIQYVLILNSYNQELLWTQEETQGIIKTISNSGTIINYSVENMDWKNYPDQENLDHLYRYYKYKYSNKKIDLILASDDAALQFALKYRTELFSNAPVVFSGINQEGAAKITQGYDNVTGIIEEIDPVKTIDLALRVNPELKNLYLLYDNTESGRSTGTLVISKAKERYPDINIVSMNNVTYENVVETVKGLKQDSAVLITTYASDSNNKIMDMSYVVRDICKYSSVPVYHLYTFGFESGATGGVMLDGTREGESAGRMALKILNGEKADNIPFQIPDATRSAMNYEQMQRYGISMKDIPEGFEIMNQPFSFYETYKTLIFAVLGIMAGLILIITILIYYITKIRRMRRELTENHEELTQLYEELTASDEEMKQQYDEIMAVNEKIRVSENKLTYLAYHDVLTDLPNKLSLNEDARIIFRSENGEVAVLFVDVDNFKNINDTLGHAFGDQLIIKVSERLASLVQDKNLLYRLGGDEFIMILIDSNKDRAQAMAVIILEEFKKSLEVSGNMLRISVSIGIALYPEHGTGLEQLLKYADIAMYKVKESGKTNFMMYNNWMNELFTERVNIEQCLPKALENREFELYYQPQYDLKQGKITGFEALLRWHSPELGNVSPIKFIKVAEENHFIIPLGTWVLRNACEFMKRLCEMGYEDLTVSVNISIVQLIQMDFCEIVYRTLKETGISAKNLELEITETVLMESIDRISTALDRLNEWNIKFVLDDFGKGYSSFNYLRQLPIKTLKVDKAFIDGIIPGADNLLAGQIVAFGKNMGMTVVAEGVETQEQWEYLTIHNCDKIQGYIYSRPKPEKDILVFLSDEEAKGSDGLELL